MIENQDDHKNILRIKEGNAKELIMQLYNQIGGSLEKQKYSFNTSVGKGFFRYYKLTEGIEVTINSITAYHDYDVYFEGNNSDTNSLCVRFTRSGELLTKGKYEHHPDLTLDNGSIIYDTRLSNNSHIKKGQLNQWVAIRIAEGVIDHENTFFKELFGDIFNFPKFWFQYDTTPLEIHAILNDIFDLDHTLKPPVFNLKLLSKACEAMSIFFDRLLNRNDALPNNTIHPSDLILLMNIKDELLANLEEVKSLNEFADKYGFSVSKLRRDFQQVFGSTIHRFHQNYRLEKAKILLTTTTKSITEVARTCGYKSGAKFSEYFKKKYGVPPKEISKKYRTL
ncbi:helix-turn-helix domain-containing protein [Flammeovirga kamogawensis]|uniref:Helix-turn-helix transcriptional regulator n=1 Tax=Flammeovirga kamogawensis TaxID=373891 RepID=A0ABX8GWC9_9BACT|nr:AraC family transcriptional regulator [Flammeovirga kamogawensis]MBB6461148.1 AraC-like DNA-binding protein [Flammeovirga kamogawensis]QWG07714.1 helix-turn-helix transcriptional regulator [Flammeovirga kamogawensis]TRX69521.1 helix-turn-helix transcriptional regulator [Flammeovirga kamogawensis]